jgi:hypothetical protein
MPQDVKMIYYYLLGQQKVIAIFEAPTRARIALSLFNTLLHLLLLILEFHLLAKARSV